ncbi:elongator complex protein 3 [Patescibacteria group bacterium]
MKNNFDQLILSLLENKVNSPQALEVGKKKWLRGKRSGKLPKNYQLLKAYNQLIKAKKIKPFGGLKSALQAKPVRTLSGVTPLAVLTKPYPCPGECLYCPTQENIPKSYLRDEPAVLRARQFDFDAQKQVRYRLRVFQLMGHQVAKVELIILGGSFSAYRRKYRQEFLKNCFEGCNGQKALTLKRAQQENEKGKRRIIGITVETRPDLVDQKEIKFLRQLGVTRVELGAQTIDEKVLKTNKRGHGIGEITRATRMLKEAGFKVCYHLMPGLPGSSLKNDLRVFKKVFADARFRPDFLKIYPCVVLKEAPLYKVWLQKRYQPLTETEIIKLLVRVKSFLPEYVRINRLGRDIPVGNVIAGYRHSHIRQLVKKELERKGLVCRCIRCREIKNQGAKILAKGQLSSGQKNTDLKLKITKYQASGGWEYFLQYVDSDNRLYALLRLRLPGKGRKTYELRTLRGLKMKSKDTPGMAGCREAEAMTFPDVDESESETGVIYKVLKNTALVRELHTYGVSLKVGEKKDQASQHQGLGKKLLARAEQITRKAGLTQIAVISGIGAREYYRKLGYQLKQTYMVKKLAY